MVISKRKSFLSLAMSLGVMLGPACPSGPCAAVPTEAFLKEGETITYDIKKFNLTVGKATLVYNGPVRLGDQELILITFTSAGFNFFDEEKIYLEPVSFLPVLVERDLNILGKKEKIAEHYSPKNGTVRIVKTVKGQATEQVIEKEHPLENIYGFIYRYRISGKFEAGEKIQIYLPTTNMEFELTGTDTVNAGGRETEAYYMESFPKKYRVWFDKEGRRIPLRIDGAVGFGKTAMIMREYRQ